MAIGSIGAYLFFTKQTLFLKITTSLSIQAAAWLCVGLICVNKFTIGGFLSHEVAGCVTLCIIISQISAKNRIINLDNKICDFLGKISYGIYVIHPLVMFFVFKALLLYKVSNVWIFIAMYPILTALTVLIAYISYEYYEKIFLKAKKKYAVVASTV
jgi:peptidoglycan/LPS O-acetylase OafA/YrhL